MEGCRIWLDLSAFHSICHSQCGIYINYTKEEYVSDVAAHVSRVLGGPLDDNISFINDGWLLLSSESSRVFRENDIVSVVPFHECVWTEKKQSNLDDTRVSKKTKQKENGLDVDSLRKNLIVSKMEPQEQILSSGQQAESVEPKVQNDLSHNTSESSPELCPSTNGISNDMALNCAELSIKRKRLRRRHKKIVKEQVCEKKESPYRLHKKLQGVGAFLGTFSSENKHVFFTDDSEMKPLESTSESARSSPKIQTSEDLNTETSLSSVGSLAKLMSLSDGKLTPVFEHKKLGSTSVENKKQLPESTLKPILLKEMPEKYSVIRFQILKMVNYSPEISKEITAKVMFSDSATSQMSLFILDGHEEFKEEEGKFSVVDETNSEQGSGRHVSLNWNELLHPHILV